MLDNYLTFSITSYDTLGNFRYQIKNAGDGPDQYRDLENFIINTAENTLELYELTKSRILSYHMESGTFISTKEVGFLAADFERMVNGNYVFFSDDGGFEKGHPFNNKLIVLNNFRNL